MKRNGSAGRAAYLAGLHAAQALIFERTGRVIKRHRGVQNELRRPTKEEPRFALELHASLAAPTISKRLPTMGPAPARR